MMTGQSPRISAVIYHPSQDELSEEYTAEECTWTGCHPPLQDTSSHVPLSENTLGTPVRQQ